MKRVEVSSTESKGGFIYRLLHQFSSVTKIKQSFHH